MREFFRVLRHFQGVKGKEKGVKKSRRHAADAHDDKNLLLYQVGFEGNGKILDMSLKLVFFFFSFLLFFVFFQHLLSRFFSPYARASVFRVRSVVFFFLPGKQVCIIVDTIAQLRLLLLLLLRRERADNFRLAVAQLLLSELIAIFIEFSKSVAKAVIFFYR